MKAEEVEQRVRELLPPGLRDFPFKIDMAQQDPRPLNPIGMQDRQIYVYDAASPDRVGRAAQGAAQVPARARSPSAASSR